MRKLIKITADLHADSTCNIGLSLLQQIAGFKMHTIGQNVMFTIPYSKENQQTCNEIINFCTGR